MKISKNRREFLKTAVPAALLTGCQSSPSGNQAAAQARPGGPKKVKSSKTGPKALTQYHPHDLPKEYPSGDDSDAKLGKLIKWDFEALIHTILQKLENGETDDNVEAYAKTRPQFPSTDTGYSNRDLNVHIEPDIDFIHDKDLVVGIVIRGCMARYTGMNHKPNEKWEFDDIFDFTKQTCADARTESKRGEQEHAGIRTFHLIYSSSSSSYRWGPP